jgi:hypothetical protein
MFLGDVYRDMVIPLLLLIGHLSQRGMFIVLYCTVPVFLSLATQNQLYTLDITLFGH